MDSIEYFNISQAYLRSQRFPKSILALQQHILIQLQSLDEMHCWARVDASDCYSVTNYHVNQIDLRKLS